MRKLLSLLRFGDAHAAQDGCFFALEAPPLPFLHLSESGHLDRKCRAFGRSSAARAPKHASDSAAEASAQAARPVGFSGSAGSVSGRMQRTVHGVDLATDEGPVPVLQDPAGPTGAGLCSPLPLSGLACMQASGVFFSSSSSSLHQQ